jgi:diguanylate cyclase (GGDEF)-like protein/hemerythrin-like metal-binding protein/PAS domain S-box-containing protein
MLNTISEDMQEHPDWTIAKMNAQLRERMRLFPELRNLLVIDARGLIRAEALEQSLGKDSGAREYFQYHRGSPGDDHAYFSRPFKTYSGLTVHTLSRVLRDKQGSFSGVVLASIDQRFFANALQHDTIMPGDEVALINLHGDVISAVPHTDHIGKNLQGGIGFTQHMNSGQRTSRQRNVAKLLGIEKMAVFHNFPDAPLAIVVGKRYEDVIANWWVTLISRIVRLGLIIGVAIFFFQLAYRRQQSLVLAHKEILIRQADLNNYRAIVASTDDAVISQSLDGIIKTWNRGAEQVFGYSATEVIGKPMQLLLPPEHAYDEAEILARIARGERVEHIETVSQHKSGRLIDISEIISPIEDETGKIIGASNIAHDITEHKLVAQHVGFLASHDRLTELPNRDLFYDRLSQAISQARRNRQNLAVLYCDLDGFKAVNDTYGHQVGDVTLKEAARRLRACVRDMDTVARLGGDEFAIVLNELKSGEDASLVAEKVINSISVPMNLAGGGTYGVGISIGIATYPECGLEIDRLIKAADTAMYESKVSGKNRYTFSSSDALVTPSADGWVKFIDTFRVGFKPIDEEHQQIVDMLNQLNVALTRQDSGETLAAQLEVIINYVLAHFDHEERFMREHNYPETFAHQEEHRRLINEMKYLKVRFFEGGELLVLQWMKDWFLGHIVGSDKQLGEFLSRHQVT